MSARGITDTPAPPADLELLRGEWRILLAGAAAFAISTMFSAMKPVLLTRFVEEAGYSQSLAGLAVAMPFIGTSISAAFMPWLLRNIYQRHCVLAFVGLLVAGQAGNTLWFAMPALVLAGQFVTGFAGGVLMGVVARNIAVSRAPGTIFGIVDMAGVLMMSGMISLIGWAVQGYGLAGGFTAALALCLLFAVPTLAAGKGIPPDVGGPDVRGPDVRGPDAGAPDASGSTNHAAPAPITPAWRPIAAIAMGVIFVTTSGLGFAYMVTAARDLGMNYGEAGTAIGIILFLSAFACLAGGWASTRFGHTRPLLTAFAICACGWYLALNTASLMIFLVSLIPAIFALQFSFPVLLALAGSMDREGHWAAMAAPIVTGGFAWAAIIAGVIVERWGISALPYATLAGMIVCAGLLLAIMRGAASATA